MPKNLLKIAILALWVGMMGWWWHVSRTFPVPEKIEAAFLPDYLDNYKLTYGPQHIGSAYKSMRRVSGMGYQGGAGMTVKVRLGDQVLEIKSTVVANFDQVLNLTDFQYVVQAGPLTIAERGVLEEDGLKLSVNLGQHEDIYAALLRDYGQLLGNYADVLDFSRPVTLKPPSGPGLSNFIPSYLSYLGLMRGSNYSITVLDPVSRQLRPMPVRVEEETRELDPELGRDMPAFRVRLGGGSVDGQLWVDRYGRTIREEGLGFKLSRVDEPYQATVGVVPLTPPKGFESLLANDRLMDIIKKADQAEIENPVR